MGILTIGIVTIPFYFEKNRKIMKALKGVEEMRKNVDSLLIINNESICDVYADSELSIKDAFKAADNILCNAAKSISELIMIEGSINLEDKRPETQKSTEEPAQKNDGYETKSAGTETKAEPLKTTDEAPHKTRSLLDKLKEHLKKGITVLTSDVEE